MTTGDKYRPPNYPLSREVGRPKNKTVYQYLPPVDGASDSADPNFKARLRPCGRCAHEFKTNAKYRYFCEGCRFSTARNRAGVRQYSSGTMSL